MTWPTLAHSKSEVKKAGKILRRHQTSILSHTEDEVAWAEAVAQNWRRAHAEAENWAQMGCRSRLRTLDIDGTVTQRLKELPTIVRKLVREHPRVQLSTMEDVAGARAVVPTIADLRRLEDQWRTSGHEARHHRDYVDGPPGPPASGYRAVHFVMIHKDRLVEIQLRTTLQNAWAELVEDVGHAIGHHVKNSEGPESVLQRLKSLGDDLASLDRAPQYDADHARELIAACRDDLLTEPEGTTDA